MADILKGSVVSEEILEKVKKDVEKLNLRGIRPTLCVIGIGNNPSDESYKKGIMKKALLAGVVIKEVCLSEDVTEDEYISTLNGLNSDDEINGILMLRPLKKGFDEDKIRNLINPKKDVDGCTDISLASVFTDGNIGYPPCTSEACIKLLDYFNVDVSEKNVCILGRSLVIGKPVSMLLLNRNATVTICHSHTKDVEKIAKSSDILITSIGKLNYITKDFVNSNQVIVDVGINWNPNKNGISGDANFDEICDFVKAITPVPGGIGAITSTILMMHTVDACIKQN